MSDIPTAMRKRFVHIFLSLFCVVSLCANDTTYVSGALQHDGILEHRPWYYGSNSYFDLSVYYLNDSNVAHFHELRATTRLELTQWPLPGFDESFAGHGIGHLSIAATFDFGQITLGDVYAQFGSGLILNLYEDRFLGIDGALRGAKIDLTPYKGILLTALGGKQRRFWNCYDDRAWGWNYTHDAVLGADIELHLDQWSSRLREQGMALSFGGSYVSKYERFDSIFVTNENGMYAYNLPLWVGAGELRANWQWKGWNALIEYAYKANDPCDDNNYSYRPGDALLASLSYSRKGLSVFAQFKRSYNMAFRSSRRRVGNTGLEGRLNLLPVFGRQHTYALAALNQYATQYVNGEFGFQTEVRYTWPRKSKMGGRYGTTVALSASHIRGLAGEGAWTMNTDARGEYYTDINLELNKRLSSNWWLNAMLMYQTVNLTVIEGEGGLMRAGIAVVEARVRVNPNISMRGELQYLYSPHFEGQYLFALYELSLYHCLMISGEYMYNIGHAPEASNDHFYTASATYIHDAHRLQLGYTKTKDGFNCSGGICRYMPRHQGLTLSYTFNW